MATDTDLQGRIEEPEQRARRFKLATTAWRVGKIFFNP
jgi:hypothetical protein